MAKNKTLELSIKIAGKMDKSLTAALASIHMDNIMQYIPLAVSAVLLAALILTVVTNIITQVLKKLTWEKIPTNILAFLVAMAVTLLAFFAACQIMAWAVTWYMVAGAVALGLFVAYAAMFGYDKLREALEQIINWEKRKTE